MLQFMMENWLVFDTNNDLPTVLLQIYSWCPCSLQGGWTKWPKPFYDSIRKIYHTVESSPAAFLSSEVIYYVNLLSDQENVNTRGRCFVWFPS